MKTESASLKNAVNRVKNRPSGGTGGSNMTSLYYDDFTYGCLNPVITAYISAKVLLSKFFVQTTGDATKDGARIERVKVE